MSNALRYRSRDDVSSTVPVHVVWEITLACNLACGHCGSRAGSRRPNELTTQECLDIVRQLKDAGTREITLIGGEAYLRKDWLQIATEISRLGMLCGMQTGARGFTRERIQAAADAGVRSIGVSIDGPEEVHDQLRGFRGSHKAGFEAIRNIAAVGIRPGVNTQVNALSVPHLWQVYQDIREAGAKSWQVQITVAMGNAVDNSEILLQPFQMKDAVDTLFEIYEDGLKHDFRLIPGNSIGYFGPYEARWRSITHRPEPWQGCTAGETTLGLEADGTIKGCPSLNRDSFSGGNSRTTSVREAIANLETRRVRNDGNRGRGFCKGCYYWKFCRGGCTWVTHSLTGRRGDNPYCYYRVTSLARQGLHEVIRKVAPASGEPFAIGRFAIDIIDREGKRTKRTGKSDGKGKPVGSTSLVVCENCGEYVGNREANCIHCGAERRQMHADLRQKVSFAEALIDEIQSHVRGIEHVLTEVAARR